MKPFGIRLAAGAVTILLGAVMAAQAQKDHQSELVSSWAPTLYAPTGDPPPPIGGESTQPNGGETTLSIQNNAGSAHDPNQHDPDQHEPSPFADVSDAVELANALGIDGATATGDAVQLVQHTQGGPSTDPVTFGLPDAVPTFQDTQQAPAADMPAATMSMNLPATLNADDAAGTQADSTNSQMNLPPTGAGPDANTTQESNAGPAAPTMNHFVSGEQAADTSQPSNFLRGSDQNDLRSDADFATANDPQQNQISQNGPSSIDQLPQLPAMPQQVPMAANESMQDSQPIHGQPAQMLRAVTLPGQDDPNAGHYADQPQMNPHFAAQQSGSLRSPADASQYGNPAQDHGPQQSQFANDAAQYGGGQPQPNPYGQAADPSVAQFGQLPRDPSLQQPTAPPLPAGSYGDMRRSDSNQFDGQSQARIASRSGPRFSNTPYRNDNLQALPAAHQMRNNNAATLGQPGDRRLEGVQSPSVVIHKRAPSEVKVGKPASFVIQVQNVGSAEALDVRVHDRIPEGMRLHDATPRPT
ncbi:MAG: hypothetical protein HKN47_28385, partial [Pirellulaceae bacterium]|nr:hypothetical protein [Pirellulaceae bacterium]